MKLDLEKHAIPLTCPACSRKFEEKMGRLKNDATVNCPGCKKPIKVEASALRRAMASVQKRLDGLAVALKGLGK